MSKLDPELEQHFNSLEQQYNLPQNLLKSVAYTESSFNPNIVNKKSGAAGMFQFMPDTAKQYKIDVNDPFSSADGAARMYADLLKSNKGDLSRALAGYNWGQGNLNKKGLDNAPQETRNYISQITGLMGQKKTVNNGSKQDFYNDYNKSMSKLDSDDEELKAYKEMMHHQQQEQEEMQAYQQMMQFQAQQQQPAQQTMTPVQVAQNNNAFDSTKNAQLNQTAINPALTNDLPASLQQNTPAPQNAQMLPIGNTGNTKAQAIASKIMSISDPQQASALFNNASPAQQEYIKGILQDQFSRENPNGSSALSNVWTGLIARPLQKTNNAMTQMMAAAKSGITGNDDDLKTINEKISKDKNFNNLEDMIDPSVIRSGGEIVGEAVQYALPGAIAKVAPAATKLARAGQLATEGAIGSIAMNPVEDAQSAGDVLKGKAMQAATGAAINAGAGLGAEYLINKGANVVNNIKNANKPLSQASQDVAQDFENQGVRYFANDLPDATPGLNKKVQNFTAKNESMRDNVAGQQQDLNKAYENFTNTLQKPEIQKIADESGLNKVLTDTSHPLHTEAKTVADKIDNLDLSDPNAILKATAEAKLIGNKSKVIELHSNATTIAPDANIPVVNASKSLSDLNDYMQQLKNTTTKNNLKPIIKDIEDSVVKIKSGQNSITDIDNLIKSVTNDIKQAKKNGDTNIASIYKDFKSSLVKDKEEYINTLPDSTELSAYKTAYSNAKDFNKQSSQEAKNLFPDGNIPDSLIKKWIQKGQTNKVQSLYDMLPDSAKQAVQQGVINKITKEATDQGGNIIPEKLVKAYNGYKDINAGNTPLNVVFDANTKEALDSLVRISKNIKNIGINANTNSGLGITDMVRGARNVTSLATAPLTHGLSLVEPVYKFLKDKAFLKGVTDPKFQKMLINLNGLNPSSSAYAKKLGELSGYIATASYNNNKE